MEIRYKYVGMGTFFPEERPDPPSETLLEENTIVVDVGSRCLGYEGEDRPILDHHFHRPSNYPCAAAAVLSLSSRWYPLIDLQEKITIVTHRAPDFDALTAAFLVRMILAGELPYEGWKSKGIRNDGWDPRRDDEFDWFRPSSRHLKGPFAWAFKLVSVAAHQDKCHPMAVNPSRSLSAILSAAIARGRFDELDSMDGAHKLFESIKAILVEDPHLNPLTDSIFEGRIEFERELDLLDRDLVLYRRDIARARTGLVAVPRSRRPFEKWFPEVARLSMRDHPESHLNAGWDETVFVDGAFLRNPRSLLFKTWARQDLISSTRGQGFEFLGVAIDNQKPDAKINTANYWFSLNPEFARGKHLYPIWARIQLAEMARRESPEIGASRNGFEEREAGPDPWYDGSNYASTIIDTPREGSLIPPGRTDNLMDDEIARIVFNTLSIGAFRDDEGIVSSARVSDFSIQDPELDTQKDAVPIEDLLSQSVPQDSLRFVSLILDTNLHENEEDPAVAQQIGRFLWSVLQRSDRQFLPSDFEGSHLISTHEGILVWSRCGIVIAHRSSANAAVEELRSRLRDLAQILADLKLLAEPVGSDARKQPGHADVLQRILRLKLFAATSEGKALQRLLRSGGFDVIGESLHSLNQELSEEKEAARDRRLNRIVGIIGALVVAPSLLLGFLDAVNTFTLDATFRLPSAEKFIHTDLKDYWSVIIILLVASVFGALLLTKSLLNRMEK